MAIVELCQVNRKIIVALDIREALALQCYLYGKPFEQVNRLPLREPPWDGWLNRIHHSLKERLVLENMPHLSLGVMYNMPDAITYSNMLILGREEGTTWL